MLFDPKKTRPEPRDQVGSLRRCRRGAEVALLVAGCEGKALGFHKYLPILC